MESRPRGGHCDDQKTKALRPLVDSSTCPALISVRFVPLRVTQVSGTIIGSTLLSQNDQNQTGKQAKLGRRPKKKTGRDVVCGNGDRRATFQTEMATDTSLALHSANATISGAMDLPRNTPYHFWLQRRRTGRVVNSGRADVGPCWPLSFKLAVGKGGLCQKLITREPVS
jgi:hypothetical protein